MKKFIFCFCILLVPFLLPAQNASFAQHSETEAKELIDSLYQKLSDGADFAKLAEQYSEDPGTKAHGGLLNTKIGALVPEFENAVLPLQPSEISKPFRSPYGYHIAQLISHEGRQLTVRHILIRC